MSSNTYNNNMYFTHTVPFNGPLLPINHVQCQQQQQQQPYPPPTQHWYSEENYKRVFAHALMVMQQNMALKKQAQEHIAALAAARARITQLEAALARANPPPPPPLRQQLPPAPATTPPPPSTTANGVVGNPPRHRHRPPPIHIPGPALLPIQRPHQPSSPPPASSSSSTPPRALRVEDLTPLYNYLNNHYAEAKVRRIYYGSQSIILCTNYTIAISSAFPLSLIGIGEAAKKEKTS